jgi:cytochrome P450
MRITNPSAGARIELDQINLADTDLYTTGDAHLAWRTLREECPVFWQAQPGGEGFWAVTRWADVRRVLAEHETFTSECGTAIAMLGASEDPSAGLMMHSTDPPRHRSFRQQFQKPFSQQAVLTNASYIQSFVQRALMSARDGESWDMADSFARLPVAVAARMMGIPESDIDQLLRLSYASLAPHDPRYNEGSPEMTAAFAHGDIINYFTECINDRRQRLGADLISYLTNAEIDGRPLTEEELVLNCLSLLLGAVVTTSHAISAMFLTLAELNDGVARWPDAIVVDAAVEEALRWSSPVVHFMRRARRDVQIRDQLIRTGEAVTAWIASANRDESVFQEPYTLNLTRSPNKHIAFGNGFHRCLGNHLARLMLRESFRELIASVESFELTGPPCHLVSNEIAGVVSLPVRVSFREASQPDAIRSR